ncbi:MAG TPA: AAA family ATPase [Phototrophicaceae bacterium]|nr:AAA family ATPase [Phototrophicaceae bacterium]
MNPIFIVVGPPAVGKSTTSRALAARFRRSIHIPVDAIREMVVSGLILPSAEWSDELSQQITLARSSAVQMALAYHQAGFAVVIDDFWDRHHPSDYQALLGQTQLALGKIILYPQQEAAHQRNLKRSGASPARAYIDEGIRIVYQQLDPIISPLEDEGWTVIDTTTMDVEAIVTTILLRTTGEP